MKTPTSFREKLGNIIFESDTPAARLFDVVLLIAILGSILLVMLESVSEFALAHGVLLRNLEWAFTILFTLEYILRVYSARERVRYISSFYGLVDLVAILPMYISLILPGSHYFLILRAVRLLRVFRVLKLVRYLGEAHSLLEALKASQRKIAIFLYTVITLVCIIGTIMFVVEGPAHGFTSIPISVYWAIVTLTTVGYGDIAPQTTIGQIFASFVMIMGYGIIAVPTGIVTVELSRIPQSSKTPCRQCGKSSGAFDAVFCQYCGIALE